MTLDRVIGGEPFAVDYIRCHQVAETLRGFAPSDAELPWGSWSCERQFEFKLLFISICHQINWDFLQDRLCKAFAEFSFPASERLSAIDAGDVKGWIGDYHKPDRVRA